jgi:hypothetical protein
VNVNGAGRVTFVLDSLLDRARRAELADAEQKDSPPPAREIEPPEAA